MAKKVYNLSSADIRKLDEAFRSAGINGFKGLRTDTDPATTEITIEVVLESDPDSGTSDEIDSLVSAHDPEQTLLEAQLEKMSAIDRRTSTGIETGHTWEDGKTYSLSSNAQRWMIGLYIAKVLVDYPVNVNTKDDKGIGKLLNSAHVDSFYASALGSVRYWLDSGTNLKEQVRAATTVAEVEAIIDDR